MSRRRKIVVFSVIVIVIGLSSWVGVDYFHHQQHLAGGKASRSSPATAKPQPVLKQVPNAASALHHSEVLPPSPPLPKVPVHSTQKQRREAFQLYKSVDHILLKNEPFEVDGKKLTIAGIMKRLEGKTAHPVVSPRLEEYNLTANGGGAPAEVRKQIPQTPVYYGVRIVRPGENLWNIDYAIIREYFARRHVILPMIADEPAPDGYSSGVGRLLLFLQGVVYIYNVQKDCLVTNPNLIHPSAIVVFFKISDLFAALNKLQPQDLPMLHYVKNTLRLEGSGENKELLSQQVLRH